MSSSSKALSNEPSKRLIASAQPETSGVDDIFSAASEFLRTKGDSSDTDVIPKEIGSYRILDRIGSGGMGRVFLGEHRTMKRKVAIKVLPQDMSTDPAMVERFYRESQTAAALDHPNIARVFDLCEVNNHRLLVMEFIEGTDLKSLIQLQGKLPQDQAIDYAIQIATGLQHAHERNIIHRDIKPSNLLIDSKGVVKILDLGIARFTDQNQTSISDVLDEGAIICSPDFASPEQIENPKQVDERTDIYSLGATLYVMLSGKMPYEGSMTQKLMAHINQPLVPVHRINREVPKPLSKIVSKMMAKRAHDRHVSTGEVITALLEYLQHQQVLLDSAEQPSMNGILSPREQASVIVPVESIPLPVVIESTLPTEDDVFMQQPASIVQLPRAVDCPGRNWNKILVIGFIAVDILAALIALIIYMVKFC